MQTDWELEKHAAQECYKGEEKAIKSKTAMRPRRARVDESSELATTKPFEFRKRLWHEPPERLPKFYHRIPAFRYFAERVQRGRLQDLEWKTNWLDCKTEWRLLGNTRIGQRKRATTPVSMEFLKRKDGFI